MTELFQSCEQWIVFWSIWDDLAVDEADVFYQSSMTVGYTDEGNIEAGCLRLPG